jgi:30S ribosomal protein S31
MGKGDRRSRRGKIFRGTFGKSRKHSSDTPVRMPVVSAIAAEAPVEEKVEVPKKKRAPRKKPE